MDEISRGFPSDDPGQGVVGRGAKAIPDRIAQLADLPGRRRGKQLNYHYAGNGYHYEADEVRACVQSGAGESAVMPLDDSIAVASTADLIRETILESANSRNNPV